MIRVKGSVSVKIDVEIAVGVIWFFVFAEVFQLLAGILELGNCEIIGGSEDDEVPFSGSATKL